jgi:hypothetical protein
MTEKPGVKASVLLFAPEALSLCNLSSSYSVSYGLEKREAGRKLSPLAVSLPSKWVLTDYIS